jgi:hypothetical protein
MFGVESNVEVRGCQLKSDGEIMEILAAFDLTGSLRAVAELVGCSHHTVAPHVAARDAGRPVGTVSRRAQVTDEYLDKIEEWVEASQGRSAPTRCTRNWWRRGSPDRTGRPGGWSLR